jgi:hypothetical protein
MIVLQLSQDELTRIISDAVRIAMPSNIQESTPQPFIKGIHELAKFLRVSPVRAQKLKNEGAFPYWKDGRTLLFDPDKVRQSMQKLNK